MTMGRGGSSTKNPTSAFQKKPVQQSMLTKQQDDANKPDGPTYNSMLTKNGVFGSKYTSNLPKNINPKDLGKVQQLKSGGTLTGSGIQAHQLGNYDNVGINSIMGDVSSRLDGIKADSRGMDAFRERALNQGPSAWANLQTQQQGLGEQTALDQSAKSQAGSMANAMSNVAMRGGMSGGGALRAARQSANDQALSAQNVRRQGQVDRLGIATSDETMRQQALSQLPGAELAWLQPQMDKAKMLTGVQLDEQGRKLQADTSNRDSKIGVDQYNASALTDADKFTSGQQFEGNKFNILNRQDVQKTNIDHNIDAKKFDIGNDFDAQKTNTGNFIQNNQFNKSNEIKAVGAGNDFNMEDYKTKMAGWAAGKTADSMPSGGKK